jgi:hypothetical protein
LGFTVGEAGDADGRGRRAGAEEEGGIAAGADTGAEPNVVVVSAATVAAETATTVAAAAAISRHLPTGNSVAAGGTLGALPRRRR